MKQNVDFHHKKWGVKANLKEGVGRATGLGAVRDAQVVVGELLHVVNELGGGLLGQQRRQVRRVRARDDQREQPPHAGHGARAVRPVDEVDYLALSPSVNTKS